MSTTLCLFINALARRSGVEPSVEVSISLCGFQSHEMEEQQSFVYCTVEPGWRIGGPQGKLLIHGRLCFLNDFRVLQKPNRI